MKKLFLSILGFCICNNVFAETSNNTIIPNTNDTEYSSLAKKFQTGDLQLYDIPEYIKYLSEKLIWFAGLIAVIIVMIGGYQYLKGGFTDSTSEGKETISNVAIGYVFIVFAWMIIDVIVRILTE